MISQALVEAQTRFARVQEYLRQHQHVFAEFEARGGFSKLQPDSILCVIDGSSPLARGVAEHLGAPCPSKVEGYHHVGLLVVRKSAFDGCSFRDQLDVDTPGARNALVFFEVGVHLLAIVLGTTASRDLS